MNASMKLRKSQFGMLRRAIVMIGLLISLSGIAVGPAMADDWRHDDRGGYDRGYEHEHDHGRDRWNHERMERERWEREHRYFSPPVVVYPQPQMYYAPPPLVMAPPSGLNIIIPLHIR